jgi:hypothetical protein
VAKGQKAGGGRNVPLEICYDELFRLRLFVPNSKQQSARSSDERVRDPSRMAGCQNWLGVMAYDVSCTSLWRKAFIESREDCSAAEQLFYASTLKIFVSA